MKTFILFIFFAMLVSPSLFAQSRPQPKSEANKINQRPPKPSPTPTPTPEPEQTPTQEIIVTDDEVIKIETNLVSIPVKVFDRNNRFVGGLMKEDFQVFEDGKLQEIEYFGNLEEPFTVALVLDMSPSTVFKTSEIQNAAIAFTAQLRPKDKVMVVSFDAEIHPLCDPTTDRSISRSAIKTTAVQQGTSLYEALDYTMERLKKVQGRKAIILFTDGVDTTSRKIYLEENLRRADESEALIFPIQYDTYNNVQQQSQSPVTIPGTKVPTNGGGQPKTFPFPFPNSRRNDQPRPRSNDPFPDSSNDPNRRGTNDPFPPQSRIPSTNGTSAEEYDRADKFLEELALRSGGRLNQASDAANMALAFSRIADELRQFYTIGFYPQNEQDTGRKRRLKVKVNREKVAVRTRDSYTIGEKKSKKKS
jgi:Ca-activated chloride channel homolog